MNTSGKRPENLNDPALSGGKPQSQRPANHDKNLEEEAKGEKATQFDGNPNVEQAPEGPFGPKDDTPWRLKKKD